MQLFEMITLERCISVFYYLYLYLYFSKLVFLNLYETIYPNMSCTIFLITCILDVAFSRFNTLLLFTVTLSAFFVRLLAHHVVYQNFQVLRGGGNSAHGFTL